MNQLLFTEKQYFFPSSFRFDVSDKFCYLTDDACGKGAVIRAYAIDIYKDSHFQYIRNRHLASASMTVDQLNPSPFLLGDHVRRS